MSSAPVLRIVGVERRFKSGGGELVVLDGVDLEIMPGEIVGLVGPSGSGKSSLLHAAGLLERPSGGAVEIAGASGWSLGDDQRTAIRRNQIGFVYQFHHLLPEFSALENVSMPLLIAGRSPRDASAPARAMLESVGLGHRLTHRPASLSGGERQRVAIARALVNHPACVLMDEPTGNLDADTAEQVQALLNTLNQQLGMAFVLVTHDKQLAAAQHRCLQLAHGQLSDITVTGA